MPVRCVSLQKSSGDVRSQISSRDALPKEDPARVNGDLAWRETKTVYPGFDRVSRRNERISEPRRGTRARDRRDPRVT